MSDKRVCQSYAESVAKQGCLPALIDKLGTWPRAKARIDVDRNSRRSGDPDPRDYLRGHLVANYGYCPLYPRSAKGRFMSDEQIFELYERCLANPTLPGADCFLKLATAAPVPALSQKDAKLKIETVNRKLRTDSLLPQGRQLAQVNIRYMPVWVMYGYKREKRLRAAIAAAMSAGQSHDAAVAEVEAQEIASSQCANVTTTHCP